MIHAWIRTPTYVADLDLVYENFRLDAVSLPPCYNVIPFAQAQLLGRHRGQDYGLPETPTSVVVYVTIAYTLIQVYR